MIHDEPTYEMACIFSPFSTDKAVKITDPTTGEELWIPLSQILEMHGRSETKQSEGTIVMTAWIARQKGLI